MRKMKKLKVKKKMPLEEYKKLLYGRINIMQSGDFYITIELDNKSIDYFIKLLLDLKNSSNIKSFEIETSTGYDLGVMAQDSFGLILENRDKYDVEEVDII